MTEEEWVTGNDPTPMLSALTPETCLRKTRLFMVACCRRNFGKVVDQKCREAIESAERFADGSEQLQALTRLRERLPPGDSDGYGIPLAFPAAAYWITHGEYTQGNQVRFLVVLLMQDAGGRSEQSAQAALLLDIFGNPFRRIVADPAWLTPTVQSIAAAIYQDRAFDHLPILADALEEAGCTNADVLLHCRQPGEHVRGCWVVDLVLGKK